MAERANVRFIEIDEDGYFKMEGLRVADVESGRNWLAHIKIDDGNRIWTTSDGTPRGTPILVEAFDAPFVALDIEKGPKMIWTLTMPYGHREPFPLASLTVDEWDRFHGRTVRGVPFVFSRSTQARFFDSVDDLEDEAFTVDGERFITQPWLKVNDSAANSAFWSELYRTGDTRWDLGGPQPALQQLVPRLKLSRSRILIPGAGTGNDAAWFASQGHLVTAVDFSEEAIEKARAKYGDVPDLKFVQADVFNLPQDFTKSFDIVFEHTLYCAISPERRNDLVLAWRRALIDQGHLLAIFATMDRPFGPPYGGSEWEIRERLRDSFRSLYWTRLRDPQTDVNGELPSRLGKELFFYGQKLNKF